jgi:hypothetical protein
MCPAEGELDLAGLGQGAVPGIAVNLQDAAESLEMLDRAFRLAVGGIDISNRRRGGPAPGPVVPGIGPELAGLGPAASWIKHRSAGLVGEQLGRASKLVEQQLFQRTQEPGGSPHPIGQSGAVECYALAGVDLRLAIEREMIGVFADDDVGDQRLGRQSTFD